jgi:lipopolysaccharide transport system permease protein
VPLSVTVSTGLKLGIQLLLFLFVYAWYYLQDGNKMVLNMTVLLLPLLILISALLALGLGLLITSLTSKYRDLRFLLQFGVQLLMYTTPIVYPLSSAQGVLKYLILANPMTGIIECFKYAFFGAGTFELSMLFYPSLFAIGLIYISLLVFSRYDKNFVDTI